MMVVFTDLDGTLLDAESYSFDQAKEGLHLLKKKGVPLVICTSKTREEIMHWRRRLDNEHPFISENGGGIFIPEGYFSGSLDYDAQHNGLKVIRLGERYDRLVQALDDLKQRYPVVGFHDMSPEELAEDAGLSVEEARRAQKRDFDEPFILHHLDEEAAVRSEIRNMGLRCTKGGRYYHLTGDNDKGRAVRMLSDLYEREHTEIVTVGIGDCANDFPMLDEVDRPYLVARPDGSYASSRYRRAGGIGPTGWNRVIKKEVGA